jgi:beta-glucosidase
LYYNALSTGRPAGEVDLTHPPHDTESKYVSRYIDEQNTPQFPFGYGLSYTTFEYGATRVSQARVSAAELNRALAAGTRAAAMNVEATVANTGSRAAEETVQLYVRLVGTSTAQPVRALKGFQHVMLAAGESKTVKFELASEALAIWNASNQFAVEPAKATVWISPDSSGGTGAQVTVLP